MLAERKNTDVDFLKVISILTSLFGKHHIEYMLVGGVALGLHGIVRGTKDIDFLVKDSDKEKIAAIMRDQGYEMFSSGTGFLQFEHFLTVYGLVDYLFVSRPIGLGMLSRAVSKGIEGVMTDLRVARLEDLVILKLLVLKSGRERGTDREDLQSIITTHGLSLDWPYIEECAKILEMEEVLNDVRSFHKE